MINHVLNNIECIILSKEENNYYKHIPNTHLQGKYDIGMWGGWGGVKEILILLIKGKKGGDYKPENYPT